VYLVDALVGEREFSDVAYPTAERVRLSGDSEARPERNLEHLPRWSREHRARRSAHERACRPISLPRPEPDRHIDRDDERIECAEVSFDRRDELIASVPAVFEHDGDPSALRPIDAGNTHEGEPSPESRHRWYATLESADRKRSCAI
jgi:hypothetical protein